MYIVHSLLGGLPGHPVIRNVTSVVSFVNTLLLSDESKMFLYYFFFSRMWPDKLLSYLFDSLWQGLGEAGEDWEELGVVKVNWVKNPALSHPLWDPHNPNLTPTCQKQCAAAFSYQTDISFIMLLHRASLCFVSVKRHWPLPGRCLVWIAVWWNATLPSGLDSAGYRNRVLRRQETQLLFQ